MIPSPIAATPRPPRPAQVSPEQIHLDMCLPKGSLEQPRRQHTAVSLATVDVARSAMEACRGAHGVCVLTDWPEFRWAGGSAGSRARSVSSQHRRDVGRS